MEERFSIPLPINFNCWKHHTGFIKEQIKVIKSESELKVIKSLLLKIGESQMDLYFGKYSPKEIAEQIINFLKRKKTFSSRQYQKWLLNDSKDYQSVELKDKSMWILRLGEDSEKYVHIHPGRYSPHTIRIKANTLKTAILILCSKQIGETEIINTESLNYIRRKHLNESPIKSVANASGIGRMINLLS